MVFHGYRLVFMMQGRLSWFFMVPGWFFMDHVENTLKLHSGPMIQSRPCLKWFTDSQIIAKCYSFPNMYEMLNAKVDRFAGKTYLVQ